MRVAITLIGWGVAQNRIPPAGSSDASVAITNAILLSLPLALLGMLLYYMLRWLKLDDPDKALLQT